MTSHPTDQARLESIEQYLDRLESMVLDGSKSSEFFDELIRGLVEFCAATAVGAWILEDGRARCVHSSDQYLATLPDTREAPERATGTLPAARLISLPSLAEGRAVQRRLSSSTIHGGSTLTLDVWGSDPKIHSGPSGLHEIIQGVTEIAVSFMLRTRLDELARCLSEQQALNRVLAVSQQPGSLEDKASSLAKTLLEALGKDRVSVFQATASGARVLALMPSSNLNQRSSQVRLLCQLAATVKSEDGWLAVRVGEGLSLSPRYQTVVEEYLQASLAREIWALGTSLRVADAGHHHGSSEGVVILEKFTLGDEPEPLPQRSQIANSHFGSPSPESSTGYSFGETLLAHALDTLAQQLSLRERLSVRITDWWRTSVLLRRVLVIGVASALLVALLFLVPTSLKFAVEGSLQPRSFRSIFATREGVVEKLYVQHGESVARDQPLLKIRSPEIELELHQFLGQVETIEAKLLSLRSGKMKPGSGRANEDTLRLSAEEMDLRIQLLGLRKQLELVTADRESLTILSPMRGRVDGWDLEQSLNQRPVLHGQELLQVFDPDEGWQLDLEVPDDVAGYILEAQRKAPCPVEFRVRSDPAKRYSATLTSIAQTTQVNADQKAVVFAKVDVRAHLLDVTRSGARVVAQIDCGRSTFGVVWFREILEFLQRTFWL